MLGSITPLGERGRNSRWWLTVSFYMLGSAIAGLATGALFGSVGALLVADVDVEVRFALLAAVVLLGLALDLGAAGLRLPTVHRQVDEDWRTSYRGWVWGLGFGLQLGTGMVTIVTSSTVYSTWFATFLTGDPRAGALVGLVFGLSRALPVFGVARVREPDQLLRVDGILGRLATPASKVAVGAGACLAAVSLAGAARW
jgi:sulfite exporter TauE/SafE